MTNWIDVQVKASPHNDDVQVIASHINMSKGIIRCSDLRDCSDEEILDELRPEGVTNVKHIFSNNVT
jgi:hypothetical protein